MQDSTKRKLGLLSIVLGAVFLVVAIQESKLAKRIKPEPQTITCADLAANGPGDNVHVIMTDFVLPPRWVYFEQKHSKDWRQVWNPAVPLDGEYADRLRAAEPGTEVSLPETFGVIVLSEKVENEEELYALAEQDTIQGLVVNDIKSVALDTKKILGETYPKVDFDRCWILDHGRTPSGTLELMSGFAFSVLLIVGGAVCVWMYRKG